MDNPSVFLQVSQHFHGEAMEALKHLGKVDELIGTVPWEDRHWVKRTWMTARARGGEGMDSEAKIAGKASKNYCQT